MWGRLGVAWLLADLGDAEGRTSPIHGNGKSEAVRSFASRGADLGARDARRSAALALAEMRGDLGIMGVLVTWGRAGRRDLRLRIGFK
mmetsp:Transcript_1320/g.3590  ORF Transcript_1320/g.3590 Transcript_1320/m.3590 type:complete len:88 (+) Transcript_1320:131-394(+)